MKFLNGGSLVGDLTITGMTVLKSPGPTTPGLSVRGSASMTADLQSWENSAGTQVAYMSPDGYLYTASSISSGATINAVGNISGASLTLNTPLKVASGGTNSTATPTAGAVAYGNGSSYLFTAAGTAGQVLGSNAAGAPTWQTLDLTYLAGSWAKKSVWAATTFNLTSLSGLLTIDGNTMAVGDRVLVKNQDTPSQNGIYVAATGAWTRAADAATAANIAGAVCTVGAGSINGGTWWTTRFRPTDTIGTKDMNWYAVMDSSRANATSGYAAIDSTGGAVIAGTLYLSSTVDANTGTLNKPPLIIGNSTAQHMRFDNNEVISMSRDDNGSGSPALGSWGFTGTSMGFTVNSVNIVGQAVGSVPLTVKAFTGQTANVFQVQSSTGTNFLNVDSAGNASVIGQLTAKDGFFTGSLSAPNLQDSAVITSGIVTAATGFTVTSQKLRQWGPMCIGEFQITFNNAVSVPSDGNIGNLVVMTLAAQYRPSTYFHLMNGNGGAVSQFYCTTGGSITFGATAPGFTIPAGMTMMVVGCWMSDTF